MKTAIWNGIARGQRVYVSSPIWDKVRGVRWEFMCHVVNERTGAEWVEVFGGKTHHRTMHAFKPEQVSLKRRPRVAA